MPVFMSLGAVFSCAGVHAGANFTFSKAFGVPSVPLNGSTSLTFTIQRVAGSAASGVNFTDPLPAGLVVSTPSGQAGDCGVGSTVSAAPAGSSISLSGGQLAGGATCVFAVNVTGTTPGLKSNTTSLLNSTVGGSAPAATASLTVLAGVVAAASIPTLSEWGLILLVLAMAVSAFKAVRRQR